MDLFFQETADSCPRNSKTIPFSSTIGGTSKSTKQLEDGGKMKVKFMETWNNLKFELYDVKEIKLKKNCPLWLLGKCYLPGQNESLLESEKETDENRELKDFPDLKCFMDDFLSKPWFSYRKGFPPFDDTSLTSDTGWGCMIRTIQMLLCQGFFMHFLGREWEWRAMQPSDLKENSLHREIISWFIDEPNPRCPFSIHRLTDIGLNYKCKPGNWYGPSTVAYIMQDAIECGKGVNSKLDELVVYVAQDCTVYVEDIREICRWKKSKSTSQSVSQRSVIILIPLRLGESVVNPLYIPCLQKLFTFTYCIGFVGGKPKHSLYFVAVQDEQLIYLDPHYSQPSYTLQTFSNKDLLTYHSKSPRKVHISKIDPSCCLGFYCRNEEEFNQFSEDALTYIYTSNQKTNFPLFIVADGSAQDQNNYDFNITEPQNSKDNSFETLSLRQDSSTSDQFESFIGNEITKEILPTSSKTEKIFSFSKSKEFLSNFYSRQLSRSPKHERKKSLEEDFEIL